MRRAILAAALVLAATHAAAEDSVTGRRIFLRGDGGTSGEVAAAFGGTSNPLAAGVRRCANCHGRDGAGGREASATVPSVTWPVLAAPRVASALKPGRPGYDPASFARALRHGIDPAGRALAPVMPRFQLTAAQTAALIDYLAIVGTKRDLDPGIGADEIRVGALLPLSGPRAAWGNVIRGHIQNDFAAAGPIYGRRLRLTAIDAGDDLAVALRRIVAEDALFALVATLLPADAGSTGDMPVVGALTAAPGAASHVHLLAPLEDQLRALVDQLIDERPNPSHPLRLAVIGHDGPVFDAVFEQAIRQDVTVMRRDEGQELPPAIAYAVDAILALPDADFARLAAQLAGRPEPVRLAGLFQPIATRDARLRFALPVAPVAAPASTDVMPVPPVASAAAAILIEGVKRMGARASRAGLLAALGTVRDFMADGLPPLNLGPGPRASLVIRPDETRGFVVLGGWRTPR
jgi:hypothetical protein